MPDILKKNSGNTAFSQMKANYFQEEGYQRRTYVHTTVLMEYRSLMLQRSITGKLFVTVQFELRTQITMKYMFANQSSHILDLI